MALNKVTDSFQDLTEEIIVNTFDQGYRDHGMWIDGTATPNECDAVVQPMSTDEMNQMNPDGDTTLTHLRFYIDIEKFPIDIQTAHDSKNAVTVDYDGQQFKTLSIKNFGKLGGFRVIYAVQTRKEN